MLRAAALIFLFAPAIATFAGEAPAPAPVTPKQVVVNPTPKPFLGVNVDENASNFDPSQGLPISAVIPGSSAAAMGVQVGDLLRTFNGAKLSAQADLAVAIGKTKVGDEVTVELTRANGAGHDKLTLKGPINVRPQVRSINSDLATLREEILTLRKMQEERKAKEISLADMLKMLKEIEDNMPAAVAAFKKQYPKGEFNIQIKIDIISDKTAKDPLSIGNQPGAQLTPDNVGSPAVPSAQSKPAP